MSVLVSTSEVAGMLGYAGPTAAHSARRQLSRWGVRAVSRQPGRGGEAMWNADEVRQAKAAAPGAGARTDRKRRQ